MSGSNVSNPIIVVQGGQWGSEAKGACAAHLCLTRNVTHTVRTGAINAGHTVVYNGERYAMQQIPVGWVNPDTILVIGAGAYIHPETLFREIEMINRAMPERNVLDRLFIDHRCGIHDEMAENASKQANRHHRIGATGKGCSEAIVNKIQHRNNGYELFVNTYAGKHYRTEMGGLYADTVAMLNRVVDQGGLILIEGTQGTLLDLHLGPYPFTTSRMTSAANWVAECGLSPSLEYEVVLVCRTYPIRVAGNSGPMGSEIEWVDLARSINDKLSLYGREPLIGAETLAGFERAIDAAAIQAVEQKRYTLPLTGLHMNTRVSSWTTEERSEYRVAASELHRDALNLMPPDQLVELKQLFEMTTVTKKLRRLAKLDWADLEFAVAINRPSWICMTFMDYEFPELRNITAEEAKAAIDSPLHKHHDAIRRVCQFTGDLQRRLDVPVHTASFGPAPENMLRTAHLWSRKLQR
jgi:adenylosuccinate synthase